MKVHALLVGDLHIREDVPICRTDDFIEAQTKKLIFLSDLQKEFDCPVICAGDVFDHWKPSPALLSYAIHCLPDQFHAVPGNHDLPHHSLSAIGQSGYFTLMKSGSVNDLSCHSKDQKKLWMFFISGYAFGEELGVMRGEHHPAIGVAHVATWYKDTVYPGQKDPDAVSLMRKMLGFDLILTGDNHRTFVVQDEVGRILVNPGSFTRQTADQADHVPTVYAWNADSNEIKAIELPFVKGVVSREHIDVKQEIDNRFRVFVEKVKVGEGVIGFRQNLESYFATNRVRTPVKEIIWTSLNQ